MMKIAAFLLSTAALTVSLIPLPAQAQDKAEVSAAQVDNVFGALPGRWGGAPSGPTHAPQAARKSQEGQRRSSGRGAKRSVARRLRTR